MFLPFWVVMMVHTLEEPQPVAIKFSDAWDDEFGLLPLLDHLENSPNVIMVRIVRARDEHAARDAVYAEYEQLMARVSGPMFALREYMDYTAGKRQPRAAKASVEEIEEALVRSDGRIVDAAKALGVQPSVINFHLRKPELRHWRLLKSERAEYMACGVERGELMDPLRAW